jgi:hypothetical protein
MTVQEQTDADMRTLALLLVFAASGCAEAPSWNEIGRGTLYVGANLLAAATGGRGSIDAYPTLGR